MIGNIQCRLNALRQQARRDYWLGVAMITACYILGMTPVVLLVVLWWLAAL